MTMPHSERLALRYAIACEPGRDGPQFDRDAAYAGPHLLVVAAGLENMSSPASPSNLVVEELRQLDASAEAEVGDLAARLGQRIAELSEGFRKLLSSDPRWSGTGTMVTAMLWQDTRMAIAHIGNSRAYMLRDGVFTQLTQDHTVGQLLIDGGHISASELGSDEKHSLITQWIDGDRTESPDLISRESVLGDRYLLATREVRSILSAEDLQNLLKDQSRRPQEIADNIIKEVPADRYTGLTVVVADVVGRSSASNQLAIKFAGQALR